MRTTDKALNHRALRQAEENYRLNLEAIFRSVRDAIITVDEQMTVVEVNPAAGEICGIWREEAVGPWRCWTSAAANCCLLSTEGSHRRSAEAEQQLN